MAVADFASRNDCVGVVATTLFSDVVRNDLDFSGILELASKSFYPTQVPSVPAELNYPAWSDPPVSAQFLAFGNLTATGTTDGDPGLVLRRAECFRAAGGRPRLSRRMPTKSRRRQFAHQFADEIIARLSGGVAGHRLARRSPSSARAAATKRSGSWTTTAPISTS